MTEQSLANATLADNPLARLRNLDAARSNLESALTEAVWVARAAGASWAEIGSELGVTRQAAWAAYSGRLDD